MVLTVMGVMAVATAGGCRRAILELGCLTGMPILNRSDRYEMNVVKVRNKNFIVIVAASPIDVFQYPLPTLFSGNNFLITHFSTLLAPLPTIRYIRVNAIPTSKLDRSHITRIKTSRSSKLLPSYLA